jgi:dynein heavy chain
MADRHWKLVSDLKNKEINPSLDPEFTFTKVLELGLIENVEKIVEIGETASKEY